MLCARIPRLDADELESLLIMSSVKRLISLGYSPSDSGEELGRRVNDLARNRLDEIQAECAKDIVTLMSNNASEQSLILSASATYALAGINIADQVHRDLKSLN